MKKFILLLLIVTAFIGCQDDQIIQVNDEISSKKNNAVDDLLDEFRQALEDKDVVSFHSLCAQGTEDLNSIYFMEFISEDHSFIDFFMDKTFQKENRYLITDISQVGESVPYASDGYLLRIPDTNFLSGSKYLYVVEGEYNSFDIVFTLVLVEDENSFKIERFSLGDIRPYGESISSLLDKAEDLEEEGYYISAWQFNELASEFVNPSPYIYYEDDQRIVENMERIADGISTDLTFPLDIQVQDDVSLKLYAIDSNKHMDGFYCRVVYVSNLPAQQANETYIQAEARSLHKKALEILPGLGQGFEDKIIYTAYFEEPIEQGKHYKKITVNIKE